jgi:hypothetical protein
VFYLEEKVHKECPSKKGKFCLFYNPKLFYLKAGIRISIGVIFMSEIV